MKNIAVIFAGGQGRRMHEYSRPKQFLEYRGKSVIAYTLDIFQQHHEIDGIVVACLENWISYLERQVRRFGLSKVVEIVPGGKTGQESIYLGLESAARHFPMDSVALIHDGVRPLVRESTITENIKVAHEKGGCVTCVPATETFVVIDGAGNMIVPSRDNSLVARAPQSFLLGEVLEIHRKARSEGRNDFIDTCTMMNYYGKKFCTVIGSMENIKITTPSDYFMFRAIMESREERTIFGL